VPRLQTEAQCAGLVKARAKLQDQTAYRAVDDPVRLARAARIVRAALARQMIELADLTPLPDPDAEPVK
jgi:hypothetical protein